jgi:hypothetical protein
MLPFILVGASILLWQMIKHVPKRVVVLFIIGGVTFLSGAIFIDIFTSSSITNTFYSKGVLVAIEESLELLGTSIILYGILDHLERHHSSRLRKALTQLRS